MTGFFLCAALAAGLMSAGLYRIGGAAPGRWLYRVDLAPAPR